MKVIDNSTAKPILKVGTPPRNDGIGEPGFSGRDESEQISYKYYDPSIRVGSPPRDGERVEELGYSGPPGGRDESDQTPPLENHGIGEPGFPGPPEFARRSESEKTPIDKSFDNTIVSIVSTSQLFQDQLYGLYLSGKINGEKWFDAANEYDLSHEYLFTSEYILTGKDDSTTCTHLTLDQLNRDGQLSDEEYKSLLSKYECVPKDPEQTDNEIIYQESLLPSQADFL